MIFASYSITDTRKEKVSFAGPYLTAGQDLLVKADNTDITGPETLNGKKLCSVTGSTSAQKVKDKFAKTVQLQEYDTYSKCVEALGAGAIDARDHRQHHPGRLTPRRRRTKASSRWSARPSRPSGTASA